MSSNSSNYRSVLIADMTLVLVAFIWGAGIPLSAVLARGLTPLWAVALRMLIAAFFLILMFPKTILTSTRRDWGISLIQTSILTCVFRSRSPSASSTVRQANRPSSAASTSFWYPSSSGYYIRYAPPAGYSRERESPQSACSSWASLRGWNLTSGDLLFLP